MPVSHLACDAARAVRCFLVVAAGAGFKKVGALQTATAGRVSALKTRPAVLGTSGGRLGASPAADTPGGVKIREVSRGFYFADRFAEQFIPQQQRLRFCDRLDACDSTTLILLTGKLKSTCLAPPP